ncbi:MAG TPA: hypothetical protein VFW98_08220 [Gemmatimonadaceae bacterium]|nr:hypothetical protein [Gemmatimonadaceae bacterium]
MTETTAETVLADWRAKAQVARALGHEHDAAIIEQLCTEFARATENYLTWLSEEDAMLYSGHARPFLRRHFPRWEAEGNARWHPHRKHVRQYRQCILPRRYDASAVEAEARAMARADAASAEAA